MSFCYFGYTLHDICVCNFLFWYTTFYFGIYTSFILVCNFYLGMQVCKFYILVCNFYLGIQLLFGYTTFILVCNFYLGMQLLFGYTTFIWVYNFYFGMQLLFGYTTFILVCNFYLGVQLLFAYINVEQPTERNMSPTQLWMTGEHPRDCDDINSQVYLIELVIFCVLYTQIKVAYQNKSCIPK